MEWFYLIVILFVARVVLLWSVRKRAPRLQPDNGDVWEECAATGERLADELGMAPNPFSKYRGMRVPGVRPVGPMPPPPYAQGRKPRPSTPKPDVRPVGQHPGPGIEPGMMITLFPNEVVYVRDEPSIVGEPWPMCEG